MSDNMPMQADKAGMLPLLVHASRSFRFRCMIDAREDILKKGAISAVEYEKCVKALLHEELSKARVLQKMESMPGTATLDELILLFAGSGIPQELLVAYLYQLAFEGFLICETPDHEKVQFSLITTDQDELKPVYVPVKAVDDGKACSGCSACQATCPVGCITVDDGKVSIDMDACIRCGLCYTACPRSFLPKRVQELTIAHKFGTTEDLKVGHFIEAWSATTTRKEIEDVRQDGGIVTSILTYLFESGKITRAIGAGRHESIPWKPVPVIMASAGDALLAAGTKYVNTPTLKLVKDMNRQGASSFAIVGTPCMMQATSKAMVYPTGLIDLTKVAVKIGIFCMESFTHAGIQHLTEKILNTPLETIKKMDINAGQFFVRPVNGDTRSASMKDISKLARMGCHCCHDLTSEMADISVGSIGSPPGWNTVLIRTLKGKDIFDAAVEHGIIQRKPLAEVQPGLPLLKKLSFAKKRNYEKEEAKRDQEKAFHPAYFMKLPPPPPKKEAGGGGPADA